MTRSELNLKSKIENQLDLIKGDFVNLTKEKINIGSLWSTKTLQKRSEKKIQKYKENIEKTINYIEFVLYNEDSIANGTKSIIRLRFKTLKGLNSKKSEDCLHEDIENLAIFIEYATDIKFLLKDWRYDNARIL